MPRWLDKILPNITIEPPHEGGETVAVRPRTPRARALRLGAGRQLDRFFQLVRS